MSLAFILLKPCGSVCKEDEAKPSLCQAQSALRVHFQLCYKKLGLQKFLWRREHFLALLKKVKINGWERMFFQTLMKNQAWHGLVDKCYIDSPFCPYCNKIKCKSHHFDLKLIALLHQKDRWIKSNASLGVDFSLSLPCKSFAHSNEGFKYFIVFLVNHRPHRRTVCFIRGEDNDSWSGPFNVHVTSHFSQLLLNCPEVNIPVPKLFHSALCTVLSNYQELPDFFLPWNISYLNGLWKLIQEWMAGEIDMEERDSPPSS